jgi:hypothetical protein
MICKLPARCAPWKNLAQAVLDAGGQQDVKDAQETLRKYGQVFGLTLGSGAPEERVVNGWEHHRRIR